MKSPHIHLGTIETAVVCGAGSGIGLSVVKSLLRNNSQVKIWATCRSKERGQELYDLESDFKEQLRIRILDATQEEDYRTLAKEIGTAHPKLDALINCVGFLHREGVSPEKRLSDVSPAHLIESFQTNGITPVLLAKHLIHLFKNNSPSLFASLSARVGSITDNRAGGWYSYRCGKAAHNMLLKNVALEFQRFSCNTLVVALHPGTTKTKLSDPFIGRTPYTVHSSDATASNLMGVLEKLHLSDTGQFFDWQGKTVQW